MVRIEMKSGWPQPFGPCCPELRATDCGNVLLKYDSGDDEVTVIHFCHCSYFVLGEPDCESIYGHPLRRFGLAPSGIQEVFESPLIKTLEKIHSGHYAHDPTTYSKYMRHFVFPFHDSTFECVNRESQFSDPSAIVTVYNTDEEARQAFLTQVI